jgi:hypothetical protein
VGRNKHHEDGWDGGPAPEAEPAIELAEIRATRHFGQMRAGEVLTVNLADALWQNEIKAGNVEVVPAPQAAPSPFWGEGEDHLEYEGDE